jgi:hypothetical protein
LCSAKTIDAAPTREAGRKKSARGPAVPDFLDSCLFAHIVMAETLAAKEAQNTGLKTGHYMIAWWACYMAAASFFIPSGGELEIRN